MRKYSFFQEEWFDVLIIGIVAFPLGAFVPPHISLPLLILFFALWWPIKEYLMDRLRGDDE